MRLTRQKAKLTGSVLRTQLNLPFDRVKLGHNTFSEDAIELIVRSCEGVLRKARNLCMGCMLEAVRLQEKQIGIENVNRVLIQPHWRKEDDWAHF